MASFSMLERGIINHRDRARQINDFSGLLFGSITPTNIDGLIEYQNKGYIIIETKYKDAPLPYGQRLALERLTDDLNKAHKPTVCIVCVHREEQTDVDVDVAEAIVSEYRWKRRWNIPRKIYTVREFIELFIDKTFNVL